MGSESLGSTIVLIVLLLLVFLAAYLTTRFLSNRGRGLAKGKYLQMKDSLYLSKDKMIALVEAGGRFYLVGISNQSMNLLGRIEKDDLHPLSQEDANRSTASRLAQAVKKFTGAPEALKKAQAANKEAQEYQGAWELEREETQFRPDDLQSGLPDGADAYIEDAAGLEAEGEADRPPAENPKRRREKRVRSAGTSAQKDRPAPGANAKQADDEIERMMQSIERRKEKLRKKSDGVDA